MLQTLLMFIPEEAYILAIVLGGFLIMFGAKKTGYGIITTILLLAILSPFIESIFNMLPTWLFILLFLMFLLSMFRLVIGKGASDHVVGMLIYDLIRAPFLFIRWVFGRHRIR